MPLDTLAAALLSDPEVAAIPLARELVPVLCGPTGTSTAGFPYLEADAYQAFRDRVPHILGMGPLVERALLFLTTQTEARADPADGPNLERSARVIQTMLGSAAITAPPDLWLLRHVLGAAEELGLLDRLLAGEQINPAACEVTLETGESVRLDERELTADLRFLHTRGYVVRDGNVYAAAPSPRARDVLTRTTPIPVGVPADAARVWTRLMRGNVLEDAERRVLGLLGTPPPERTSLAQTEWTATLEEIELGYRVLPVVLGLRRAGRADALAAGTPITAADLSSAYPALAEGALRVLVGAGVLSEADALFTPSALGRRTFARGPGPFGIIEAYHAYMSHLASILVDGRDAVWVNRSDNVAASQDANQRSFSQSLDALDRFCDDTGFTYDVFIEHALGRGEATRQRWTRSGDAPTRYFGADLEQAAIDAAAAERAAGRLPADMVLVSGADIGEPAGLLSQIRASGASTEGAVMVVGNGFHEVRRQTRERMARVFRGYHDAGIVLLFTEASALSTVDLLATAWNTYHAGFMYVHTKSGQGLRPARPLPPEHESRLPTSWTECAEAAGYVRLRDYSSRSRTAYPTTPSGESNPAISVNHFFVPTQLAHDLGLS